MIKLDGGELYNNMVRNLFPSLRHSDYKIIYSVREFTIGEIKEIIKKHPQQLSLQERYLLSNTYETGSREFNDIYKLAVRMFPDDPTANLNASSIALNRHNWSCFNREW